MVLTKRERTSFKRNAQGRVTKIQRYSSSRTPVSDSLSSQTKALKLKKKKQRQIKMKKLHKTLKSMRDASKRMERWTLEGK